VTEGATSCALQSMHAAKATWSPLPATQPPLVPLPYVSEYLHALQ
jgi:hypothetical protein